MNELKIFENDTFGKIRTISDENESWFCAMDVCRCLEIANSRDAIARLDDDEKNEVMMEDCIGRKQRTKIVSESGLYTLILSSRKKEAKAFRRWITHEVIPSIRKTGSYSLGDETINNILKLTVSKMKEARGLSQDLEEVKDELYREKKEHEQTKLALADEIKAKNNLKAVIRGTKGGMSKGKNSLKKKIEHKDELIEALKEYLPDALYWRKLKSIKEISDYIKTLNIEKVEAENGLA
jgi:prophage antirepressor-like protein